MPEYLQTFTVFAYGAADIIHPTNSTLSAMNTEFSFGKI